MIGQNALVCIVDQRCRQAHSGLYAVYATEYITLLLPLNLPSTPSFLQNVSQKTLPPEQAESKSSLKKDHLWHADPYDGLHISKVSVAIKPFIKKVLED